MKALVLAFVLSAGFAAPALAESPPPAAEPVVQEAQAADGDVIDHDVINAAQTQDDRRRLMMRCGGPPPPSDAQLAAARQTIKPEKTEPRITLAKTDFKAEFKAE